MSYESCPLHTIYAPNGDPYISVIESKEIVRLQLHKYDNDDIHKRIYLAIDKRFIPDLIAALQKINYGE